MRRPSSLLLLGLALLACNPSLNDGSLLGTSSGDDAGPDASLSAGDDAGSFVFGDDTGVAAWDAGPAPPAEEAAVPVPPGDDASFPSPVEGGPDGACTHPLEAGDLLIDELMIESVAGAGDDGEWLEIANAAGCAVNLRGLHGEAPVGAKVHTFDVTEDVWIPPHGTFLVADSEDPAINHDLPGVVLAWAGHGGDILRNKGGTVTLRAGDILVDSVTWPSMKLVIGSSIELPADCPAGDAADFGKWQTATVSFFPGFYGTPNAPNGDVQCP